MESLNSIRYHDILRCLRISDNLKESYRYAFSLFRNNFGRVVFMLNTLPKTMVNIELKGGLDLVGLGKSIPILKTKGTRARLECNRQRFVALEYCKIQEKLHSICSR